jgi:hypothetical protein
VAIIYFVRNLASNSLTGEIPSGLLRIPTLERLDVSQNNFENAPADFETKSQW